MDKSDIQKRVALIVPLAYNLSASQRFRIEAWQPVFEYNAIKTEYLPFFDRRTSLKLYTKGHLALKISGLLKGFVRRYILLLSISKYDYVFIHREATPVGPPIWEWIVAKMLRKKIIYDFDDAIWINPGHGWFLQCLKCYWKVGFICKWSQKVSAGNEYLMKYGKTYNNAVHLIPTVVDTDFRYKNLKQHQFKDLPTIGWTGSHSTLRYLDHIFPLLTKVKTRFHFMVIADRPPNVNYPYSFKKWNADTEIEDLLQFDIGLMPLEEDAWSEGKCGFKVIQYQALGIPPLASPVGVNKQLIAQEQNGYLCYSEKDWVDTMEKLLKSSELRQKIGIQGRKSIVEAYSLASNIERFLLLFDK